MVAVIALLRKGSECRSGQKKIELWIWCKYTRCSSISSVYRSARKKICWPSHIP